MQDRFDPNTNEFSSMLMGITSQKAPPGGAAAKVEIPNDPKMVEARHPKGTNEVGSGGVASYLNTQSMALAALVLIGIFLIR